MSKKKVKVSPQIRLHHTELSVLLAALDVYSSELYPYTELITKLEMAERRGYLKEQERNK